MSETLFVSWVDFHGRSRDLAGAVGAEAAFIALGSPLLLTAPLRHLVQGIRTIVLLARSRPTTVYVMAPPAPLTLIGLVYGRATGARLVIDAHTAAVMDRRTGTDMKPWFTWIARRAYLTLVATEFLAQKLRARGLDVMALDDPPLEQVSSGPPQPHNRPLVTMPASWDSDEPIRQVIEVAHQLSAIDFVVTGRHRRTTTRWHRLPPNLRLPGRLSAATYADLLLDSDAVLALTTAECTMQRAAYEALAYEKPLVISDTHVLRHYFTTGAVFVDPRDPNSIADGIALALQRHQQLSKELASLRKQRAAEWGTALAGLKHRVEVGLPPP
ncbi:MAG TPA: glycosyltransferase [Acidimicrobiales bacterium]|nr:glycosyltransferase [Acidimicrobiales bacterium]